MSLLQVSISSARQFALLRVRKLEGGNVVFDKGECLLRHQPSSYTQQWVVIEFNLAECRARTHTHTHTHTHKVLPVLGISKPALTYLSSRVCVCVCVCVCVKL